MSYIRLLVPKGARPLRVLLAVSTSRMRSISLAAAFKRDAWRLSRTWRAWSRCVILLSVLNFALKVAAGVTYLIHWLCSLWKEKEKAGPSHFLSRYIQSSISIGSMFSLSISRWRVWTTISTRACSRYVVFSLFLSTAEASFLLLELPMIKSTSRFSRVTGPSFMHFRCMHGHGHYTQDNFDYRW